MKKLLFKKGEKAILVVYLPETKEVEVIEQSKFRIQTKIKYGEDEIWVDTYRLRKIFNVETNSEARHE